MQTKCTEKNPFRRAETCLANATTAGVRDIEQDAGRNKKKSRGVATRASFIER
jgi:hypothetical protein